MTKRDLRRKLVGHFLVGRGELITRDVNRPLVCERCGGELNVRTDSMTGQALEECRRCGVRQAVRRFQPSGED
ncbi:MAG: hypothetical protein ACE5PT_11885 [Gemmatimonadales bacterium]